MRLEKLFKSVGVSSERICTIDTTVIFQGEDPSMGNPNFWDELFLLKV